MNETPGTQTLFTRSDGATFGPGQPASPELTIHVPVDRRWGGSLGAGANADPTADLFELFRLAPIPVGSLRMERETWEAMGEHKTLRFMAMRGDGACFLSLDRAPKVEVVIHPVGRGVVAAMGSGQHAGTDWSTVELARIVGAVQDPPTLTSDERRAYAVYLVAFADPKLSAAEVERMTRPWARLSVPRASEPEDEERRTAAALAALGSDTFTRFAEQLRAILAT